MLSTDVYRCAGQYYADSKVQQAALSDRSEPEPDSKLVAELFDSYFWSQAFDESFQELVFAHFSSSEMEFRLVAQFLY